MFRLRYLIASFAFIVAWLLFFQYSHMNSSSSLTMLDRLNAHPLEFDGLPMDLAKVADTYNLWNSLGDNWGGDFPIYPDLAQTGAQDGNYISYRQYDENRLCKAANALKQRDFYSAERYVLFSGACYPEEALGKQNSSNMERCPWANQHSVDGLSVFGLTHYVRGHINMNSALPHSERGNVKEWQRFSARGLYDFRRSIAAFQVLGNHGCRNGGPLHFYGPGVPACAPEAELGAKYGGFRPYAAYLNIAAAYLRCGDNSGYPYCTVDYLVSQDERDRIGHGEIGAVVRRFVETCTDQNEFKGDNPEHVRLYRMTMALLNLELAERANPPDFQREHNYLTGLALKRLSTCKAVDSNKTLSDAADFFEKSLQSRSVSFSEVMPQKELMLTYLQMENYDAAEKLLKLMVPVKILEEAKGPNLLYAYLCADMGLYSSFSHGLFENIASHDEQFQQTNISDKTIVDAHREILRLYGAHFLNALSRELHRMGDQGQIAEAALVYRNFSNEAERHLSHLNIMQTDSLNAPWRVVYHDVFQSPVFLVLYFLSLAMAVLYCLIFPYVHWIQYKKTFTNDFAEEILS